MGTVLRLLQPVEDSWRKLGHNLLTKKLQHRLDTIEDDCFRDKASQRALDDVFTRWLRCTLRVKRTWQTLYNAAKKHGDQSLEKFVQGNDDLESKLQYVTGLMNKCILYRHN